MDSNLNPIERESFKNSDSYFFKNNSNNSFKKLMSENSDNTINSYPIHVISSPMKKNNLVINAHVNTSNNLDIGLP